MMGMMEREKSKREGHGSIGNDVNYIMLNLFGNFKFSKLYSCVCYFSINVNKRVESQCGIIQFFRGFFQFCLQPFYIIINLIY